MKAVDVVSVLDHAPVPSFSRLEHYFDQVWIVNIKRRSDRLEKIRQELRKAEWPFRLPQVYSAIEGDKVGVPKFWQTGGGSYGCIRSHISLLERAIQDDVGSILVLEDDAVFARDFSSRVWDFLQKVPVDWQCLMLGGQHINSSPIAVVPGVVQAGDGGGIQRTHCYALRGPEVMKALYRTWANAAVHCDWVMGPCMAKFKTYAPDPFLVGQGEGKSDISGAVNTVKFWRSPTGTEPVVVLSSSREVMEGLQKHGWHSGYTKDRETGVDVGLRDIYAQTSPSSEERISKLRGWIEMIQGEVLSLQEPAICTVWHPRADVDEIRRITKGKVWRIRAYSVDAALARLPLSEIDDESRLDDSKINVVLLRAPRPVMEELAREGWHAGHWRDEVTGVDNGIRRLFASTPDPIERQKGLSKIVRLLDDEVRSIPNGIATLWFSEIVEDMLDPTEFAVLTITANDLAEARAQLSEHLKGMAVVE